MRFLLCLLLLLSFGSIAVAESDPPRRIALTFDDAPRQRGAFLTPDERAQKLIAALGEAGVAQAAFYITPGRLEMPDGAGGEARIAAYVSAGHVIANHSFHHRHLSKVSASEYLADIDAAEVWLKGRAGHRPWFRFPYLDEGGADKAKRDAVRQGLRDRGLRTGYVTADGSDWHLEALTVAAAQAGRTMDMEALRRLYVMSQMSGVEYHDELARRTMDRSPMHVLLLHETDLAALFLPDLVAELRRHGWTIVTIDEAMADPISTIEPDVPYASGTVTGSIAWQQGVKPPAWPMWMSTAMIEFQFEQRVVKEPTAAAR